MIRSVVAPQNSSAPNENRWELCAEIRAKRGWTEPPIVSR